MYEAERRMLDQQGESIMEERVSDQSFVTPVSRQTGTQKKSEVKRYNLVLPGNLFDEVQTLANEESISILEMLKRFIKIGLVITKLHQSPNASVIIREGNRERELVFL